MYARVRSRQRQPNCGRLNSQPFEPEQSRFAQIVTELLRSAVSQPSGIFLWARVVQTDMRNEGNSCLLERKQKELWLLRIRRTWPTLALP
jgi:hypothetical protein